MMKLSKFFKIGVVALLATSMCFVACKKEEDDDVNEMLSGSNNNYSINFHNDTGSTSRGYKTTTFKHLGALCQMTMRADEAAGAMGYIWDLESNSERAAKDPRRFFIVGFNYGYTKAGNVAYYVSRYTNVTDISANNFGVGSGAEEKTYLPLNDTNVFVPNKDDDGNIVVTVNVYEGTYDADGSGYKAGEYNGTFVVDIYNGKLDKDDLESATPVKKAVIPAEDIGYLAAGTSESARQKNGAVYANVYQKKTLKGSWKYIDTYSADEVVEE